MKGRRTDGKMKGRKNGEKERNETELKERGVTSTELWRTTVALSSTAKVLAIVPSPVLPLNHQTAKLLRGF